MSAITTTAPATTATASASVKPLITRGALATAAAAVATAAVAAAGDFAGISTDVGGEPIPASGFATMTVICSVVGLVYALILTRWARRPRATFIRTTIVLTALSWVPDVLADASTSTKALLMLTHVVAAAIVIPAVARRLSA